MPEFEQNKKSIKQSPLIDENDNFVKDTWDILAEKSKLKPFFVPSQADYTSGIRVCGKKERRVIKHSLANWIQFFIFIVGICVLGVGWIVILQSNLLYSTFFLGLLVILLFFLFAGLAIVSGVNTIILDDTQKKLILKYGKWFWNKQLSLDADRLSCRTFTCDKEFSNKKINPGMLVVALSNEYKKQEIILVAADKQNHAKKAFDAIAEFLNSQNNDQSLDELELENGKTIKYSTSCVEDEQEIDRRSFKIINEDIAVLKSSYGYLFLMAFLAGAAFGVFLIVGSWLDETAEKSDVILGSCLGFFFLLACLIAILWLAKRRITGFCLSEDLLYNSVFANRKFWWKKEAAISDIAALQVCSVSTSSQSGNSVHETTIYQLLAIMADADDNRKFLSNSTKPDKILADAKKLSIFLNLPLIDNTQK